ncbi:MAG: hypothetical protein ACLSHP_11755 [Coprococcus sp.]
MDWTSVRGVSSVQSDTEEQERFHVVAMAVKYHDTRSMIDGQIHDIAKVSQDIVEVKQQLEKQLGGRKLHDVCIAAAGRVLKTAIRTRGV